MDKNSKVRKIFFLSLAVLAVSVILLGVFQQRYIAKKEEEARIKEEERIKEEARIKEEERIKTELHEIVFKNRSQDPDKYTVYIKENGEYEPFLVIEGDYGGNVLLLRKFLCDEKVQYHHTKSFFSGGGYYPLSDIDAYLTNDYFSRLSPELQEFIPYAAIEVATQEAVWAIRGGGQVEEIQRKIFLLSGHEMGMWGAMMSKEGKPIAFFATKRYENHMPIYKATRKDGGENAYWLRSAYHLDDVSAWYVRPDGAYVGGYVSGPTSFRPAFCLPGDTSIILGTVDGEQVYVLAIESE